HCLVAGETAEVWCGNDDEEVAGEEDPERRRACSERSRHQVPDERRRDDDRTWRDHGDRDRIEKLPLREPLKPLHDPTVEKRHDGEPAPKDERARLCEVPSDSPERVARAGPCSPETSQTGPRASPVDRNPRAGRPRTTSPRMPPARNTHTISDSVHAVTTPATRKIAQRSGSLASVIRTSFQTLRPMIAITAAPMP